MVRDAAPTIRSVQEADLPQVAALADAFNVAVGRSPGIYSAAALHDVVFGPAAFVSVAVAAADDRVVGYATYHDSFDPFLARRALNLADLFVLEDWRSRGIGARLMAYLAVDGARRGGASLWWGVDDDNLRGQAFYRRLGARDVGDRIYIVDGSAFAALADGGGTKT